jgi:hypothetical protein
VSFLLLSFFLFVIMFTHRSVTIKDQSSSDSDDDPVMRREKARMMRSFGRSAGRRVAKPTQDVKKEPEAPKTTFGVLLAKDQELVAKKSEKPDVAEKEPSPVDEVYGGTLATCTRF